MSSLRERIEQDYKEAFKAGQRVRIDTLRLVKAAMQRAAIDKRKEFLDDPEILQVLSQQAKQRRETIDSAKQTARTDVLSQATEELALITSYLPPQLSEEQLKTLIEEAIKAVGLQQGAIMKQVMSRTAGSADGKMVSQLVAARLKQEG